MVHKHINDVKKTSTVILIINIKRTNNVVGYRTL